MRPLALLLSVAGLSGCVVSEQAPPKATPPPPTSTARSGGDRPLPSEAEIARDNARAEKLGLEVFRQDFAAALASDVLLASLGAPDKQVAGWVVMLGDGAPTVFFFDRQVTRALYVVELGKTKSESRIAKDQPLPDGVARRAKAHRTAVSTPFPRARTPYNAVVVPRALVGEPGMYVYLLAATTTPGEVMAGGHVRMALSDDGATVSEVFSFTKSLASIPPPPPGAETVEIMVSHLTTDTPTEVHVFLSLLHDKPLRVVARTGQWLVRGGAITRAPDAGR